MEWAVASIGGFCVGTHFIVEHQRLSGLGYCFSASLPPMLCQAAISALNRFEKDPQIFAELRHMSILLHEIFSKFTKLVLKGNKLSPVKHLYIATPLENPQEELKKLNEISDKVIFLLTPIYVFIVSDNLFFIYSVYHAVLLLFKLATWTTWKNIRFATVFA